MPSPEGGSGSPEGGYVAIRKSVHNPVVEWDQNRPQNEAIYLVWSGAKTESITRGGFAPVYLSKTNGVCLLANTL